MNLSKSKYCSAVQCLKMLWLKNNKPEEADESVMNQAVLDTGNEVGDLAMGLFGKYIEVPFGDLGEMIRRTEKLLDEGTPIIAEASFSYKGLFCSVDILKNMGNRHVELYEVKSATSVHDIYYYDTAYQTYVLTQLGYFAERVCVVHVNNQYVRQGELEIEKLFTIVDVTEKVRGMQEETAAKLEEIKQYLEQTDEPLDDIGPQCFSPYDCVFWKYCTRELPKPNVFNLAGLRKATMFKYYRNGLISFEDLDSDGGLKTSQRQQVEHEIRDCPPEIDTGEIKEFLSKLSYPLYFLDFESFQPAVPLYDNSRPYEQIVFQYSLHWIEEEGGRLNHTEFLAYPGEDPRRALAEQLCRDIPLNVCTTAYNMTFEKGRIKGLAELYPDLSDHLMNIHDHIVDLMVPFQKRYYYTRAMQGSYSIKYVLPALFPEDPELDYHNLEGVHNGTEASAAFENMSVMSPEELEVWREHLLKYCGLDTFAMVKVWEKLKEAAEI